MCFWGACSILYKLQLSEQVEISIDNFGVLELDPDKGEGVKER